MIKVKLEVIGTGPYIKAPEHCPYAAVDTSYSDILTMSVNSSICPLCKLCDFSLPKESLDIKTEEFVNYLTLLNTSISISINNQNYFLRKNDRIPLVVLISPSILDSMLNVIYLNNPEMLYKVKAHFLSSESPLCYILGCPVYFSRKLTKSEVMVVGEVSWK